LRLLIEVADGPSANVPGASSWDAVLAANSPAPRIERGLDDLYMLYTGGTTGMPKGVMYAMGNFTAGFLGFYTAPMGRPPVESIAEVTGMTKMVAR
jgi:fatty-acyl-CoA synthase